LAFAEINKLPCGEINTLAFAEINKLNIKVKKGVGTAPP